MHTHSPTWDDCQQLLKTLFTTEERERILTEARKNVPGDNGRPTTLPNLIDERFPLNRPDWDFGNAEGRERLRVYRQTLMAGPRAASGGTPPYQFGQETGGKDYRPVQDLREVNKRVEDIHPTVPNPYTLLSHLPPSHVWYTTLDLKDAFFSIALAPSSQQIFAFEWHDGNTGTPGQLTWTRLPQGFKNSPTLFNEALNQDLNSFRQSHNSVTLLQYVDDLLLAAPSEAECRSATGDLLQELGQLGYRASAKKAQICRQIVTYLGYKLKEGTRWLTEAMKETIFRLPVPTSAREVREFLGTTGYCRLWILGYAEIAKPLYEATKDKVPWAWGSDQQKAYDELKVALLRAPALALPDPLKPFTLFVDERRGIAKGVLMQHLGPWKRPVAYLSKKLDPVAAGWPPCLRIIAAVALMVKDADKLTFGQQLKVVTPHAIEGVLKYPPGRWMTNARLIHY
ncbi:hypothetical protein mRhiFer1_010001 [Rhinolophus ferrumequinum]|uniref:Reverse transcriptase domain-containing protein n=1 Tax=Rhinolophus ferrumequinum TaxID=59479 RepID=A0A7J7Y5B9_RHIFE|nr:hypothetical protein mRhiFer1_010001 [Rhinolophus ferrumequinum]